MGSPDHGMSAAQTPNKKLQLPADAKLFTAPQPNAPFPIDQVEKDYFCLISDGTLFVSESEKSHLYVLSFKDRLRMEGFTFKEVYVTHSALAIIYAKLGLASKGTAEATDKQLKVVNYLRAGADMDASDLHFTVDINVTPSVTRIDARVDGELVPMPEISGEEGMTLMATIYQSMCDVAQPMFVSDKPQDARLKESFVASLGLKGARFASRPTDKGVFVVLRLLKHRPTPPTLIELGFLKEQETIFKHMMRQTNGINVVGGPTGGGKSTTISSALSSLMEQLMVSNGAVSGFKKRLITVEDPPEYEIIGAIQTMVQYAAGAATDEEISLAWARAISNLMRLDPDIGFIGEVRDLATAMAAFRMSLTGHPVWTTLHANDAVQLLVRLLDLGVDVSLLTDPQLVTGLVSQQLAPKLCTCALPYADNKHLVTDADLAARIERFCNPAQVNVKRPGGCNECSGRGVRGRTVVAEAIAPTRGFMDVFRSNPRDARLYWVEKMNGLTRNAVLIRKINDGLIDPAMGEDSVCGLDEDEITLGRSA